VLIHTLPFRVGRESRMVAGEQGLRVAERRKFSGAPNNELYLIDAGPRLQVSRNHFQVERDGAGGYQLTDRGSACGVLVVHGRSAARTKAEVVRSSQAMSSSSAPPYHPLFFDLCPLKARNDIPVLSLTP